jgi:Zinc carboxypeptidase
MSPMKRRYLGCAAVAAIAWAGGSALLAQRTSTASTPRHITSPKEQWGHNVGDDYFLVNYQQLIAYYHTLAQESDRVHIVEIGRTSENRPHLMAVITSPANWAKIARYKSNNARLAHAEGMTDDEAHALAREGKTFVWIDGGIHATEVLGAQGLIEHVYQMASRTDEETLRFLDDTIQLVVEANPDGMDLVSDLYMQKGVSNPPVLYHHYAGHDDNRDFYMSALAETTNETRIQFREWFPEIVYDHHQTGPAGTVMFAGPFRDPYNYYQHPYAINAIDALGALLQERYILEGKYGVTQRKGAPYSTWFNGGIRTGVHFHNMIGILTETIGNPTPQSIPFVASHQIGDSNTYFPIAPQPVWHFRQSIEYELTGNRAALDFASRYREKILYDFYKMGKDEIQWGSEDHWTFTPHKMARVQTELVARGEAAPTVIPGAASASAAPEGRGGRGAGGGTAGGFAGRRDGGPDPLYTAMRAPELRDPRGFIIPSDQPDFGTATRFVNALIKTGVTVLRATAPFAVAGKSYPVNSYIVKTAQAFRPQVLDMFEPQDHPDDIPYPGGPPTPPYDSAGYTLAFQMGVRFDRVLDAFDGPFVKIADEAKVPAGAVRTAAAPIGYYFTHQATNGVVAVNRLLAAGEEVSWLSDGLFGAGTFFVAARPTTLPILQKAATELGLTFEGAAAPPSAAMKLHALRIGLVDHYGGGMPVGWTRLIFKDFEFPYVEERDDLFGPDINAGNLRAKYDVLVFNGESLGGGRGSGRGGGDVSPDADAGRGGGRGTAARAQGDDRPAPQPLPEKYTRRQGAINADGLKALKQFVEDGGTIVAIGSSTSGAVQLFNLPLVNHLVNGDGTPFSRTDYYVPGSLLRVALDARAPVTAGLPVQVDVFFDNDPVWKTAPTTGSGVRVVGSFADAHPLHSGWAWGQEHLDKGIVMADAAVGKGHVFLFANELLFRAQPHGNFMLFFNALYLSSVPNAP